MTDELLAVADVVGLVVFGVGEDHQDAVGREVVHLAPEARADEETLGRRTEHDALLAAAVEEAHPDGAGDADAELAQLLMGVEAAADTRLSAMNPIDPTDHERQGPAELSDGKLPTRITMLRDINELDERV